MSQRDDVDPVAGRGLAASNGGAGKSRRPAGQIWVGANMGEFEVAIGIATMAIFYPAVANPHQYNIFILQIALRSPVCSPSFPLMP